MALTLAANLSLLFTEHAFIDRFDAAAAAGFAAVEIQFCAGIDGAEVRRALEDASLQLVLCNAPAGDLAAGELGLAADLANRDRLGVAVAEATDFARLTGCARIHVLSGQRAGHALASQDRVLIDGLRQSAEALSAAGLTMMIEALNDQDFPTYAVSTIEEAASLLQAIDRPGVALQFDAYHAQRGGGDVLRRFERHSRWIGHVQVAGAPDRAEPDEGELDCAWLLKQLPGLGYDGFVGCEYYPRGRTNQGLGWARAFGVAPRPD